MVQVVPGLPPGAGGTDRHADPSARARRQLPPLHARRPDGRRRRLPRGAARGRGPPAGARRGGPAEHGPVVHPDGRVPGFGRDHRAQPTDGHSARSRLRRRHGRRVPAGHVRPHRADAADPAAGRVHGRSRLARRPVTGDEQRLRLGGAGRLRGEGRVPARRLRQRCRTARRRQGVGATDRATTWPRWTNSSPETCSA